MWMIQQADMENVILVDGSDVDIVSFDDSEQFEEEDSVCSWISDSDQVLNWAGWKCPSPNPVEKEKDISNRKHELLSLIEISARSVARNYPFEIVEHYTPPIPEGLQRRIAFWSFPENEEEIRLYSCLACGSNDKFKLGDVLAKSGNVKDVLQIGFHLNGVVTQPVSHTPAKQVYNVAITFDRGHITSCHCSCRDSATWCEHATAVCLYRIFNKNEVSLRAPVSESLTRLERDQLQKFAQYLITELPQQILPTAQRLLDELLSSKESAINLLDGAPDPTAGASLSENAKWVLDEISLRENIKKILGRFCGGAPLVVVDINSTFLTSAPPVSLEWSNFVRSFQSHDPEPMWNLLSIVRHMFAKGDQNASNLLNIITEECLNCIQMILYWKSTYNNMSRSHASRQRAGFNMDSVQGLHSSAHHICRYASAHLMEEIVLLWELAVMVPYLPAEEKLNMKYQLQVWNHQIETAAIKNDRNQQSAAGQTREEECLTKAFTGFNQAVTACDVDWDIYYEQLTIFDKSNHELSIKARSAKYDDVSGVNIEKMYNDVTSALPANMDEFQVVNKLTQAMCCHGFVTKASKLASILAKKIIFSYPDKVQSGVINFSFITEKANNLCEMVVKSPGNETVAFELAILGLTVPRLPAQTNNEEVKLSCLEMSLYGKLKNIRITDEQLAFIRYQAKKMLANPMLRGDSVLALIMATFTFEVLCGVQVSSTVLHGNVYQFADACKKYEEDEILGYQCALVSLGLSSNAVDQKQPMLCESIRHHRRDLALALLTHARTEDKRVEEVLTVLLDKERYPFMSSTHNTGSWVAVQDNTKTKHRGNDDQPKKFGFTFADIRANVPPPGGRSQERPANQKLSSDSDSGHGDGCDKRSTVRNLPAPMATSRKNQRRHSRQNGSKNKNEKSRPWVKHNKTNRTRKQSKAKSSRELTESDSGQEMHFSFEGDGWSAPVEDWDEEVDNNPSQPPNPAFDTVTTGAFSNDADISTCAKQSLETTASSTLENENCEDNNSLQLIPKSEISDGTSGGGSSVSSNENLQTIEPQLQVSAELLIPTPDSNFTTPEVSIPALDVIPVHYTAPEVADAGFDDDFNIEADMFQRGPGNAKHTIYDEKPPTAETTSSKTVAEFDSIENSASKKPDSLADAPVTDVHEVVLDEATAMHASSKASEVSEQGATINEDFRSEDEALSPSLEMLNDCVNGVVLSDMAPDVSPDDNFRHASPQASSCESLSNDLASLSNSSSADSNAEKATQGRTLQTFEVQTDNSEVQTAAKPNENQFVSAEDLKQALESVNVLPAEIATAETQLIAKNEKVNEKSAKSKKSKQKKNKKTKNKMTMNIQSIEAEAYSLFELAKSVLSQARNSSVFSEADEIHVNNLINRRLQLAAFQIGLFALNLHNYSSPNWFSRTYSSYVSWIDNQTIDIGASALRVLNEKWEGTLTPLESIQIASRASRAGDTLLKRTAAELALSCLVYSQSLSPNEITQTITMCREQDLQMLERACSAVENAGRNGGVQPELFFRISREWHYIHDQTRIRDEATERNESTRPRNPRPVLQHNQNTRSENESRVYITPEQFVQEQMHQKAQEMLGRSLPRSAPQDQFAWIYPPYCGSLHHCPLPQQTIHSRRTQNIDTFTLPVSNFPDELNLDIPRSLQNAYRVGMRALEALTLRMPDDRPTKKYALAPPSSEDIRWLCALSASLGPAYLKNFCKVVYNAVTSPYLLHDLALEAARHFAMFNPAQLASYLRSPSVSPIVQKALAMYTELVHHDLVLLGPQGYADFVDLLRRTRSAFCMAPGGMTRFNDILDVVRKTYPKKRELWQLIMNGLSKA